MKPNFKFTMAVVFTGLAASLTMLHAPAQAQVPATKAAPKGINQPPDPRVQQRTYHFADTSEDLPYAVFVSSKNVEG